MAAMDEQWTISIGWRIDAEDFELVRGELVEAFGSYNAKVSLTENPTEATVWFSVDAPTLAGATLQGLAALPGTLPDRLVTEMHVVSRETFAGQPDTESAEEQELWAADDPLPARKPPLDGWDPCAGS